ncbi:hypothetical protein EYF80_015562 [Liparis tanakae]|uniref:Uncharacterized protein n=1 Tax=Liparis tanakae TaxID=230148 RepID=A0A4Z2I7T6_9TELE|nr:hypothetical protein EYF80_015562 [Liparis tanakae]
MASTHPSPDEVEQGIGRGHDGPPSQPVALHFRPHARFDDDDEQDADHYGDEGGPQVVAQWERPLLFAVIDMFHHPEHRTPGSPRHCWCNESTASKNPIRSQTEKPELQTDHCTHLQECSECHMIADSQ